MADGNRSVLLDQQQGRRFTDNIAAPDYDRSLAGNRNLASLEDLDQPGGRTGYEARPLGGQKSGIHGVESVNVLVGGNRHQHLRGVDLGRKGQLHQNAVYVVPGVEVSKQLKQLVR